MWYVKEILEHFPVKVKKQNKRGTIIDFKCEYWRTQMVSHQ